MFASGGYDPFEDDSLVDLVDAITLDEYEGDYTGAWGGMALQLASARWTAGAIEIGLNIAGFGLDLALGKFAGDLIGAGLRMLARPLLGALRMGIRGVGWARTGIANTIGRIGALGGGWSRPGFTPRIGSTPAGVLRPMGGICFVAGTLVATVSGAVPIETIEAGALVLSRDENTGEVGEYEVARTFVTEDQPYVELTFECGDNSETVGVTLEHPFWLKNQGWTAADDLAPGDQVYALHGGWVRVGSKTLAQKRATVYNFEVKTAHTYCVGEWRVWVHNSCAVTPRAYSVAYQTRLKSTSYPGVSRLDHFREANESLLRAMERDPQFARTMRLGGINLNRTRSGQAPNFSPSGWTWHHALEPGVMQLVPRTQHTIGSPFWDLMHPGRKGGYSIWGEL